MNDWYIWCRFIYLLITITFSQLILSLLDFYLSTKNWIQSDTTPFLIIPNKIEHTCCWEWDGRDAIWSEASPETSTSTSNPSSTWCSSVSCLAEAGFFTCLCFCCCLNLSFFLTFKALTTSENKQTIKQLNKQTKRKKSTPFPAQIHFIFSVSQLSVLTMGGNKAVHTPLDEGFLWT